MSRARFWISSILMSLLVWGIGLISAFVALHVPGSDEHFALTIIPPVLAVFLIGVWAADHWWTRGSLLIALPLAVTTLVALGTVIVLLTWDVEAASDETWTILALFMLVIVTALGTMGAIVVGVVVAALGVWIGRQVR